MVCIFGTFFNFLNIIVVGHKDMRSNPINLILGAIAVADILLMLEYIPYSVHMYIMETEQYNRTREEKVGSTGMRSQPKMSTLSKFVLILLMRIIEFSGRQLSIIISTLKNVLKQSQTKCRAAIFQQTDISRGFNLSSPTTKLLKIDIPITLFSTKTNKNELLFIVQVQRDSKWARFM